MTSATFLSTQLLSTLVRNLRATGTLVIAPAKASDGRIDYRAIEQLEEADLSGDLPRRSLKEFFLPPTEPLFRWRDRLNDVDLSEVPTTFPPRVVLGARPCDAAALETLDKVMGWDYRDELWFGRRESTTVISTACPGFDKSCFCTATGLSPDSKKGSDLLLVPAGEGFRVETVTAKGQALIDSNSTCFCETNEAEIPGEVREKVRQQVQQDLAVPLTAVKEWLEKNFSHPFWDSLALRCHGCGACAAVCPTCHCFDIVDEPEGIGHGTRRRNWDTCQTGRFTLHASGHNPREHQNARFRQRILHKFYVYPSKFGEVLCTGCGRCARACPAGMDLPEILTSIAGISTREGVGAGGAA